MTLKQACFTRQCWAFVLSLLMMGVLIIALATPWYTLEESNYFIFPPDEGAGDALINFYWNGVVIVFEPYKDKSWTKTYSWDYFDENGSDARTAKQAYLLTMAFTVLTLLLTALLSLLILFCLIIKSFRKKLDQIFDYKTKWIVFFTGFLVFVLAMVSWSIFFDFQQGLADMNFGGCEGQWWCGAFVGVSNMTFENTAGETVTMNLSWAPSVGWVFGLGSTVVSFWLAFLLFVVKQENYERVNVNEYIW